MNKTIGGITRWISTWPLIIALVIGLVGGYYLRGSGPVVAQPDPHDHTEEQATAQKWTCSMHPQIQMDGPGQCALCGMDLIPVSTSDDTSGAAVREVKLSPAARKLAAIATAPVERRYAIVETRMVGKVDYDESRVRNITAWIPGRLDRLYVDYTGVPVKKGEHLVSIYSPQLLTAQEELLAAKSALLELEKSNLAGFRDTAKLTVEAAREKLRLWGLTPKQISTIEKQGKPDDHMTIYSPVGGIVVKKDAVEGLYVNTGTPIYTIADFSQVWVKLDVYEQDLVWVRYGQEVDIQTEAYAGESFRGTITFIDPVLSEKTRTVKVRVNVPNLDGRLKPGMFVRATVRAKVAAGGKVMDAALAGKWTCPMHPDVITDGPGSCPQCEMPLVSTESQGYVSADDGQQPPLLIPSSAPLITGRRAVVYVALKDREGEYQGREIVLGPRAGDYYIVREGLEEGELVVTNGNFKLDSAIQIMAGPSMMNPPSSEEIPMKDMPGDVETTTLETPLAFREQIDGVLEVYFRIQYALSHDNPKGAKDEAANFQQALQSVDMKILSHQAHMEWMQQLKVLSSSAKAMQSTDDIAKIREQFMLMSRSITGVVKRLGSGGTVAILQFFCPMAFDNRGAHWLQDKEGVENPYFGDMMFQCGEEVEKLVELEGGDGSKMQ
jgi:membrane fusion protein, copper/silver efflux system